MLRIFGIPFAVGAGKTEPAKESESPPAKETEKKEQADDKKVLSNQVAIKKPRSQSLIPVYVRVNVQSCSFWQTAPLGCFGLCFYLSLLISITMPFPNTSGGCTSRRGWLRGQWWRQRRGQRWVQWRRGWWWGWRWGWRGERGWASVFRVAWHTT